MLNRAMSIAYRGKYNTSAHLYNVLIQKEGLLERFLQNHPQHHLMMLLSFLGTSNLLYKHHCDAIVKISNGRLHCHNIFHILALLPYYTNSDIIDSNKELIDRWLKDYTKMDRSMWFEKTAPIILASYYCDNNYIIDWLKCNNIYKPSDADGLLKSLPMQYGEDGFEYHALSRTRFNIISVCCKVNDYHTMRKMAYRYTLSQRYRLSTQMYWCCISTMPGDDYEEKITNFITRYPEHRDTTILAFIFSNDDNFQQYTDILCDCATMEE